MLSVIRQLSTASIDMPDVFSDEWCELHDRIDRAEKHVGGILDGLNIALGICASGYGYSLGMYYYIDSKRREWELAKAKCQKPKVENDCPAGESRSVA